MIEQRSTRSYPEKEKLRIFSPISGMATQLMSALELSESGDQDENIGKEVSKSQINW